MSCWWASHSYHTTQQVPEVGELVMLAFPAPTINFPYGPRSTYAPSRQVSSAGSQLVTTTGTRFHYVLVQFAMRNSTNERTLITILPVMSYSNGPPGFCGIAWDADAWMRDHASDLQKMYHLPMPAEGWTPPQNSHPLAPVVSFNNWINNRRNQPQTGRTLQLHITTSNDVVHPSKTKTADAAVS
ncbi:hypothetical protein FN846DRAFT_911812 [Sphaerosporella brunnea]|uniref:Uncharacterized protein n=1 Tax=Sphaerosporella brunnea TaxID=1250544 RepID=A0A5J5EJM3_9PEZI|nr:hypothetical protein FN846DRAFT_911812 [Sphaerosporella brunnea]